ncbi:MAG: type II secretion system minor pseudopilin GspI [Proteobacteria bacterium]|nr:type II secretion system minor pseudopilin GspI [Pseudomonadota bacterium]MBU1709081.1 type II secretion system minor pseudopilin GspI [Pseudomonadota bacterium]
MREISRSDKAFTLLEILVALAILSIIMAAALKSSGTSVTNAAYLRDRTLAHWVAMNKAADLRLAKSWIAPGVTAGEVNFADNSWQWQVTVVETPDPDMRRAAIVVGRPEALKSPLAVLNLFIGRPST